MTTPAKKKPLGAPIALPEADSPEDAAPDQRDIQRASELAKVSMLIFALFTVAGIWDASKQRYRNSSGYIPLSRIRGELDKVIKEARNRVRSLSQSLIERRITLAEWQQGMRDEMKAVHVLMGGVAQGGKTELSPAALTRIGEVTQEQYGYLNRFAKAIEAGQKAPGAKSVVATPATEVIPVTTSTAKVTGTTDTTTVTKSTEIVPQPLDGRVLSRAGQYANAGRGTYTKTQQQGAEGRGYKYALRERNSSESCPGCIDAEGYYLIEDVPEIGAFECRWNCLCEIVFLQELPAGKELIQGGD